jgi:hypothetical protein
MGLAPLTGSWVARNTSSDAEDYSGALKWGTGINPVHQIKWEGPPLRTTGREPGPDDQERNAPEVPGGLVSHEMWGYTSEDIASLSGNFQPGTPGWGTDTTELRAENYPGTPPWGYENTGDERLEFGLNPELAMPLWNGTRLVSFPTETVTEGWDNKLTGQVLAARTSDPAQYERQTSMQQVNPPEGRNNASAVARGTDDPRENIMTRLTGMKIKPWSTGERSADMFPFQQLMGIRPFRYRTAATGNPANMEPNEMYVSEPVERVVPPDPDLGAQETQIADSGYGYTDEDGSYYA